jgi:hypothetical protein
MRHLKIFLAIIPLFLVMNSCQKSELRATIDEVILSQQETQTDEILSDVDLITDEAVTLNANQLKSGSIDNSLYLSSCTVVTLNTQSSPQVLTLDFGTGCTGKDGKVRSGKITVTSAGFNTFPSVRTRTFDNFFVDGKKISGSIVKTILKDNVNNTRTATLVEDITIQLPNNEGIAQRKANFARQYQLNTLGVQDDNKVVSWGTFEFTRVSGIKVTKTVPEADPLIYSGSCHHIVSGKVTFNTSTNHSWAIDFGDGTCDNKAILTIGNFSKEITIR